MKRLILFTMMCLFGFIGSINAQTTANLVIGAEGTDSSTGIPTNEYYNYSISQQIYTAEEMRELSGTITSIAFKQSDNSARTRNLAIYLLNTTKDSFQNTSDWVSVTSEDLVWGGNIDYPGVADEWIEFQLQKPFEYTGENLLVCVCDNSGNWQYTASFYTYSTGSDRRAIHSYRDGSIYDPANPNVNGYSTNGYNNVVKFDITLPADFKPLRVNHNPIALGDRPNGAWMRPVNMNIGTKTADLKISAIESTDSYYEISDVELPTVVSGSNSISFDITHGEAEGAVNAQLLIFYKETRVVEKIDMTAFAYNPVASDVWELAEAITSYPFSVTPDLATTYDNYLLPGEAEDGKDVVYEMNFDNDVILSANVEGENGKVAVYTEDFNGEEGPMADNNYNGPQVNTRNDAIEAMVLPAGKYYIVASSTTEFTVNVNAEVIPAPEKPINPTPAHCAKNIVNPSLSWDFGAYTVEYQVLFGNAFPPVDVYIDWTNNLEVNHLMSDLNNNKNYFWQVNVRNTSGTTYGDVWGFTTSLNVPTNISLSDNELYEGESTTVSWQDVEDRSHKGYNVYVNGEKNNKNVINGNSYTIEGLDYNMNGHKINVSAVYEEGESALSSSVYAYVTGMTSLSGNLYEQDGVTPIGEGTVVVNGSDEFGAAVSYTFIVDETGSFSGDILAGQYEAIATVSSYQNAKSKFKAEYGVEANVSISVYEFYFPVKFVRAEASGDTLVNVVWSQPSDVTGVEDFETGDFSSYEWNNEVSDYPWVITTEHAYDGIYSMKSTCAGVELGVSAIEVEYEAPADGVISFFYKVSSEKNYDQCIFYVDGNARAFMSGEEDWTEMKVTVEAGLHTYRWEYQKDLMWASGDDVVYIDHITFYKEADPYSGGWLYYDNGVTSSSFGMGAPEPFYWAVAFPPKDVYNGYTLTKISMVDYYQNVGECTVNIHIGGETAPGTLVSSQTINFTGVHEFVEYELETPVTLDGTETLWIAFYCDELAYPAAVCDFTGDPNSDWLSLDGTTWGHISDYNYLYTWMVRGFLEKVDGKPMMLRKESDTPEFHGGVSTGAVAALENQTPVFVGLPVEKEETAAISAEPSRAFTAYNLYKKNVTTDEVELLVENIADTCYADASWASQEPGAYQWGISALYEGNRGIETYYTEDFESGVMPTGWSTSYYYSYASYYGTPFMWYIGDKIDSSYDFDYSAGDGNYSAFTTKGDNLLGPNYGFAAYITTGMINIQPKSTLSLIYTAPASSYYGSQLVIELAESTSGPWSQVWASTEHTTLNADDWRDVEIDLSDYVGTYCIRFAHKTHPNYGYGGNSLGIDNLKLSFESPESSIVWSKAVDKDMNTTVSVHATTDSETPAVGAKVIFENLIETNYVYTASVGETGDVTFEDFHKGKYRMTVSKNGYISNVDNEIVSIWDASMFNVLLTEELAAVEGLYVSPTGWAMWDGATIGHGDEFLYDFEDGTMGDWINIDADGDGHVFESAQDLGLAESDGHNNSENYVVSESYNNSLGPLSPDNYMVTAEKYYVTEASALTFWAGTIDPRYPEEHFGVAVSTTDNTSADNFTTIAEWTLTIDNAKELPWYEFTADLSAYAGQYVYLAIRHFNCSNQYILTIDDIQLTNIAKSRDLVKYQVLLDGIVEAENVSTPYYQHQNVVDGQQYTTTVIASYTMGDSEEMSYTWTKVADEIFAGVNDLEATYKNETVELTWTLPAQAPEDDDEDKNNDTKDSKEGTWAYYDNGVNEDAIGGPASFSWAIKLRAADIANLGALTKVAAFDRVATNGTFDICLGGDNAPGTSVLNQAYTFTGINNFVEIELTEAIDPEGQNVWIVFNTNDGTNYPAAECADTGDADGRWIYLASDGWFDVTEAGIPCTWMLRGYFEEVEQPEDEDYAIAEVLGVMIYRNGEVITSKPVAGESYSDIKGGTHDEYCVRVVYGGELDSTYYAMSEPNCVETEFIIDCEAPKDLFAEVEDKDVTLTLSYNPNPNSEWLYYDNGTNEDGIGGPASFYWGIMFPAANLAAYEGSSFTKVSLFDYAVSTGDILVYYGGTTSPGELVHTQPYSVSGTGAFVEFDLTAALPIDPTMNVWVVFSTNEGTNYPAAVSANTGDPNGRWVSMDGATWEDIASYGISNTWMIRAYVTSAKGEVSSLKPIADYEYTTNAGEVKSAGRANTTSTLSHYNVYRGTSETNMEVIGETTTKTYVDENVSENTYYYAMTAVYEEAGEECESEPANAYGSDETYVVVTVTAIDENGVEGMMVYPNPTKDNVTIKAEGIENITVTNALGQVIMDQVVNTDNKVLNMSQYEAGVYTVRIVTANGVAVERITVVK